MAHLQHLAREAKLAFGGLIVAGADDVYRRAAQCPPQQLGRVLLDLDDVGKVFRIFMGGILFLAAIAVLMDTTCNAPMLWLRG